MSAAPANVIYREARGRWRSTPLSPGLAVGRTRSQLYGAGDSFAAATLATMFQRGSQFAQGDRTYDFNVAQVAGFDGTGTGGAFVVWGVHPCAASELAVAGIASVYPFAGLKRPLIVGPNAEVYAEIGNTATAAAGLRQVTINGRLVPINASLAGGPADPVPRGGPGPGDHRHRSIQLRGQRRGHRARAVRRLRRERLRLHRRRHRRRAVRRRGRLELHRDRRRDG